MIYEMSQSLRKSGRVAPSRATLIEIDEESNTLTFEIETKEG